MKTTFSLGLLLLCLACPKEDEPIEGGEQIELKDVVDLVPQDNEISGWTRSGEMDIAENETQLWDLINGEGIPYIENGFVKCAFQNYQGEISSILRNLELRIFDMGDTTNAKNVYHDGRIETGTETPWTDNHPGVEARIDETLLYHYKIDFWDDRFYVAVTIDEKTTVGLNVAKLFALNVSEAIRE